MTTTQTLPLLTLLLLAACSNPPAEPAPPPPVKDTVATATPAERPDVVAPADATIKLVMAPPATQFPDADLKLDTIVPNSKKMEAKYKFTVNGFDLKAQTPDAATRGESMPVAAGETCVIKGRNLKVGGPAEANAGITLTRQDKSGVTPIFIPAARLFPNTPTQVGFVMPAGAEEGSVWQVKLCTQLSAKNSQLLKEPRTVVMDDNFVVGQPAEDVPGGGDGGGLDENPLG